VDESLRCFGRRDPQRFELGDLLLDLPLERLRGLSLFLERLGLLLKDPGEAGGADASDIAGT
jgi:hypothetical protein